MNLRDKEIKNIFVEVVVLSNINHALFLFNLHYFRITV
jgi:hypothetical protein